MTERATKLDAQWQTAATQFSVDAAPLVLLLERHMEQSKPGGNAALARRLAGQFNTQFEKLCARWFRSAASPFLRYRAAHNAYLRARQNLGEDMTQLEKTQLDL